MNQSTGSSSPFFSVVIPVYNKEKFLLKTIESVLKQSFTDFELLLVLDPSTDRSSEIAQTVEDSRIRFFKRDLPGPGGYAARNLGVANAKAKWIVFQDADDLWKPDHLLTLWQAITIDNVDVDVVCTSYYNEQQGKLSESFYYHKFKTLGSHHFNFEEFLLYRPIHTINFAVVKTVFTDIGGFPENKYDRGGDYETWLRMMNYTRKGYWIDKLTAIYNKDVTDGVIKSTVPLTYKHPVYVTAKELLANERDPGVVNGLKRFSNSFVKTGVKYQAKTGKLSIRDVRAFYSKAYFKKSELILFYALAFLPGFVQRFLSRLYKSL